MARGGRLVVGLGNPGPEYDGTRHNIGFRVADVLAEKARVALDNDRDNAIYGWGSWKGRRLGVAKPMTFMNLSGKAVRRLANRFDLEPEDILVVFDDVNLPVGTIRLRAGGSAGGHNGVEDIIEALGTDAFVRLRIGVGSDFPRGGQSDYVLSPFDTEELPQIDEAVGQACDAALMFVREGLGRTMNTFNRRRE